MNNIKDILDGPEFFTCEHFKTRMLKKRCVERQEGDFSLQDQEFITSETGLSFEYCKTCEQGRKIRDEIISVQPKPQRGKGDRRAGCIFYNDCIDRVVKRDWKTFNCESCPLFKSKTEDGMPIKDKIENTRACETDGCENITLNANCPLCASCMAKKSNEKRAIKKTKRERQPEKTKGMHKDEKASPDLNTALIIDFGKYLSVLSAIKQIAEEELRPVDMQVIYMLKRQLNDTPEVKRT